MIDSVQVVWEVGQRVFADDELNKILQRGRARESAEGGSADRSYPACR